MQARNLLSQSYSALDATSRRNRRCVMRKERPLLAGQRLNTTATSCCLLYPALRLVMTHLVPVNMMLGRMPLPQALAQHGLEDEYAGIVVAVKKGDLRRFEDTLLRHRQYFLGAGVYILIQQNLRNLVMRALFRRVYVGGPAGRRCSCHG